MTTQKILQSFEVGRKIFRVALATMLLARLIQEGSERAVSSRPAVYVLPDRGSKRDSFETERKVYEESGR